MVCLFECAVCCYFCKKVNHGKCVKRKEEVEEGADLEQEKPNDKDRKNGDN